MSSEKFCLRWNDFESNISSAFRELRDDKDFFDITLACEDEQMQAHKVILSACSPFFRNILRRNQHQHPLLYLKGVKYTDLQSVLNFMYHGEVNVAQEDLNSFLAVAEDLRVKGLTQNQSRPENNKRESYPPPPKPPQQVKSAPRPPDREIVPTPKRPRPLPPQSAPSYTLDSDEIQEIVPVKSEPSDPMPIPITQHQQPAPLIPAPADHYSSQPVTQALAPADDQAMAYQEENYEDYGQYEEEQEYVGHLGVDNANKGLSFQDPSELLQFVARDSSEPGKPKYVCTLCNKFGHQSKTNVRNHVESKHFPNVFSYTCEQCGQSFPSKNNVQLHRSRVHKPKSQDYSV